MQDTFYGPYGGSFIPEILLNSQQELFTAFEQAKQSESFKKQLHQQWKHYSGRPTPLTLCENLTSQLGGAEIYLKREDSNQSGAHKMNNVIGQALLTQFMGKKRVIAETGAGQHGIATALISARLGLDCTIYMGARDIERQYPNVFWMKQLGATVIPVTTGSATLKDALDEAMRDWAANHSTTHYLIGTSCGCAPFPEMVSYFQSVIGDEIKAQSLEQIGRLPDAVYACVGGGSNACGAFLPFIDDDVELVGVEAGGLGDNPGEHAKRFNTDQAKFGIAQGYATRFLQDNNGQLQKTHSISAGLDYVGVSPILAQLADENRVRMISANDREVIEAFQSLAKNEGILAALESSHAVAGALREASTRSSSESIVINLSGRGDKDIFNIASALDDQPFYDFLNDFQAHRPGATS
jgi:tryptophan synthase beta chain